MISEQDLREAERAYDRRMEVQRNNEEALQASIEMIADGLLKAACSDADKIFEAITEMDQANTKALVAAMEANDHTAIGVVVSKAFREYWSPDFEEDARDSLVGIPKHRRI